MISRSPSSQFRFLGLLTLLAYLFMALSPSQGLCQDSTAAVPAPEEFMTTLHEGDPAPFDGTLLNVPAAARILTDLRLREEECRIEVGRSVRLAEANMQLRIDTEVARYEALQYRHTQLIEIRDQQVAFLTAQLRPPEWYQRGEFWYAMGVISGVAVTVLAGYALSLVPTSP